MEPFSASRIFSSHDTTPTTVRPARSTNDPAGSDVVARRPRLLQCRCRRRRGGRARHVWDWRRDHLRLQGRLGGVGAAHGRCPRAPRTRWRGHRRPRARRARSPPPLDHRPVEPRRAADGRFRARPDDRLQRLHLQLRGAARGAFRPGLPLLLRRRHRGDPEGLPRLGRGLRRAADRHVRLRHPRARDRPRGDGARPLRHQAALSRRDPRPAALRLLAAGAARGRRRRHVGRSRGAASLHELPRRRAGARDDPRGRAQAAAGHRPRHRGRRSDPRAALLDAVVRSQRRRAGGRAAFRRRRFEPDRRAAGGGRPDRPRDLLDRLRERQRRTGRRVRLFRPGRRALRHPPPPDLRALGRPRRRAARRRGGDVGADGLL